MNEIKGVINVGMYNQTKTMYKIIDGRRQIVRIYVEFNKIMTNRVICILSYSHIVDN